MIKFNSLPNITLSAAPKSIRVPEKSAILCNSCKSLLISDWKSFTKGCVTLRLSNLQCVEVGQLAVWKNSSADDQWFSASVHKSIREVIRVGCVFFLREQISVCW